MTCPFCGGTDTDRVTYDDTRRELRVQHSDGWQCAKAPVDQSGSYRGWGQS